MTLGEAKDQVAGKYGQPSWSAFIMDQVGQSDIELIVDATDEAAELYAKSKWSEACETVNKMQSGGVYQTAPPFKP